MLSTSQAATMVSLQAGMNAKVDENWLVARYPYLRAVVIEGAEAIEHHGWKWWKHQELDLPQLQMELIDIWHFMLSELILNEQGDFERSTEVLLTKLSTDLGSTSINFDTREYSLADLDLVAKIELLIGTSVARRVELGLFAAIMVDCELSWDDLYCQYVGKNVLNFFRQDNGYKQGTYQKVWNGQEDNEHLVEVLEVLDAKDEQFQVLLYTALQERYTTLD
jgi:hypothetical protein